MILWYSDGIQHVCIYYAVYHSHWTFLKGFQAAIKVRNFPLFFATFSARVRVHVHKLSLLHPAVLGAAALGKILAGGGGAFVTVITDA